MARASLATPRLIATFPCVMAPIIQLHLPGFHGFPLSFVELFSVLIIESNIQIIGSLQTSWFGSKV